MKRKIENLQEAVDSINITEEMQKEIIQNVKTDTKRKKYRFSKAAVAAALIAALSGALSMPVRAFVNSFIQERMEKVPEEEMTALADDLSNQEVEADSLSRAYTKEEERKMTELAQKYKEGTFPKGELAQAESIEEAERLGFCFLVPNSTFYLPDRELTEEELLQIIDFHVKREYALRTQYEKEYADELAKQKEDEEQKKAEIIESGGITEEEAVEIAEEWLIKIYGIIGDGLESNHHFSEGIPIADKTEFYYVSWGDLAIPNRQYYSFYIDAEDGSLARTFRSRGNMEEKIPSVEKAKSLLPGLEQNAVSFAEEQLQQTYKECYYVYYSINDTLNKEVNFIFVQEDNGAFVLTYFWNGIFRGFYKTQFSTYQEKYEDIKESVEMAETFNHRGEEIDVDIFFEKFDNLSGNMR